LQFILLSLYAFAVCGTAPTTRLSIEGENMQKQEADEMNAAATSYAQEQGYQPAAGQIAFSQKGKSQGGFTGGLRENVTSNWEASMLATRSSTGRKVRMRFGIEVNRVYERKSVGEEWKQTSIEFKFGDGTIHGYPSWGGVLEESSL
jgi:hypothetical protein